MGLDAIQSGYLWRCGAILLLCAADVCINAVADFPARGAIPAMPYIFVGVQFAIQVVNLLLIFMLFSGTYLFQVGMVGVQVREFRGLLALAFLYLVIYTAYAAHKLVRAPRRPPARCCRSCPCRPCCCRCCLSHRASIHAPPRRPARRTSFPPSRRTGCGKRPASSSCRSRKRRPRSSTTCSCSRFARAWAASCGTIGRRGSPNSRAARPCWRQCKKKNRRIVPYFEISPPAPVTSP